MMRKTLTLAVALTLAHAAQAAVFDTPEAAAAAAKQALIDAGAPASSACINRTLLGGRGEIVLIGTDSNGKTHYAELRYRDADERFVLDVHTEMPDYLKSVTPGTQSLDADCQPLP